MIDDALLDAEEKMEKAVAVARDRVPAHREMGSGLERLVIRVAISRSFAAAAGLPPDFSPDETVRQIRCHTQPHR